MARRGTNIRVITALGVFYVALALVGCGGESQDAGESPGTRTVAVTEFRFPAIQRLGEKSELSITVRNDDDRALDTVALTLDGLDMTSENPRVAARPRPIWVIDEAPEGGQTALRNTWSLGRLEPGATKTFRWRLSAVRSGSYGIKYKIAASLYGKLRAELADGSAPEGAREFVIRPDPDPRTLPHR